MNSIERVKAAINFENHIQAFSKGLKKFGVYAKIPKHWWGYPVVNDWNYNDVPPLPTNRDDI